MNQLLLIAAAQRERPSALRVGAVLHATKQSVRPERGPIAGRTSAGGSALTLWISPSTVRPVLYCAPSAHSVDFSLYCAPSAHSIQRSLCSELTDATIWQSFIVVWLHRTILWR